MDYKELIELSKKAAAEWEGTDPYHQAATLITALCEATETLLAEREAAWISVEERVPKGDEKCLCRYGFKHNGEKGGMMFTGCLYYYATDETPHWQHGSAGLYVTHWMPLPAPLTASRRRIEVVEK